MRFLLVLLIGPTPTHAALSAQLRLSHALRDACASAFGSEVWPEPEEVAAIACSVIAIAPLDSEDTNEMLAPLPQGEYRFAAETPFDERVHIVEPLAYDGDSRAAQTLGLLLFSGVGGCSADARMSARWHAAAASLGNIDGLATLGGCIRRGVGAEQDADSGRALIEAAAAAASPMGLCKLGVLHDEGEAGLAQDSWEAVRCFEAAAAQGSALGRFHFGWALVHGIGTPRDVPRGLEQWVSAMRSAPEDGAEEAAYYLYEERALIEDPGAYDAIRPTACLRLSVALEFDLAVQRLARAEERRRTKDVLNEYSKPRKKERFIRNDKARQFTAKELRAMAEEG